MERIYQLLQKKCAQLKKINEKSKKSLQNAPENGSLRVVPHKHRKPQFYLVTDKTQKNGKYLRQSENTTIKAYCQKEYDRHVESLSKKLLIHTEKYLNTLQKIKASKETLDFSSIFSEKYPRKEFVCQYCLSNEDYSKKWTSVKYNGRTFSSDAPEVYSIDGKRVRSKSEKIIADRLSQLGVPYRYEAPHKFLDQNGLQIFVYPDFTILDLEKREEIIYEHFGLMDDPEYLSNVLKKIKLYSANGWILGKNFYYTMESSKHPLDIKVLDQLLNHICICR